ncbi:hypothetical protein [Hymenobacter nivis]|uniref:Uncharacterized protein n=1 Tax=Hymenobacter nivis TaxID=1850093 RepID=A0A502GY90_9BACT|nr:hypothetical protein [Hymenobacter nivis]TPG67001.1 hypothetical protein EAH73_04470 [Hymenobacter nivis]
MASTPDDHHEPAGDGAPAAALIGLAPAAAAAPGRRQRLAGAAATTATKLLPLVALLDAVQPAAAQESVFRVRRKRIQVHLALVRKELQAERPRRRALAHAFQTLAYLVREETRDISPDELKQAAKEMALATLKNAPALLNAAHQARLLS